MHIPAQSGTHDGLMKRFVCLFAAAATTTLTLFHTGPKGRFRTDFAPGGAPGVAGKSESDPGRATFPGLDRGRSESMEL